MLFHLVIAAVSVECLLGDKSAESPSSVEEPIARGGTLQISGMSDFIFDLIFVDYNDIEGGLVETDPAYYYNNYYTDQAYAPYYQK